MDNIVAIYLNIALFFFAGIINLWAIVSLNKGELWRILIYGTGLFLCTYMIWGYTKVIDDPLANTAIFRPLQSVWAIYVGAIPTFANTIESVRFDRQCLEALEKAEREIINKVQAIETRDKVIQIVTDKLNQARAEIDANK